MFLGVPFTLDETVRSTYTGSFFALLNPFAIVCGLVSLSMLCAHGGAWLMLRTDGALRERSAKATKLMGIVYLVTFIAAGAWLYFGGIQGYTLVQPFDTNGVANPLAKEVITNANPGWMNNYSTYPITMIAPIMGILGGCIIVLAASKAKAGLSFLGSSLAVIGAILTAGFALFPFLMPSNLNPDVSLTMWDAVSSKNTLTVMTVAACIFVPLILCYTTWCYYKMWGVITNKHIQDNSHSLY
jgi:cytochrome bd ubiquinol oxidase subunit II